jgi:hypothetical protein
VLAVEAEGGADEVAASDRRPVVADLLLGEEGPPRRHRYGTIFDPRPAPS